MLNMKPDNRRKITLTCIVRIIIISFDVEEELEIKWENATIKDESRLKI